MQIAHNESAAGLVRREDFQLVTFRETVAAQEVQVLRIVGRSLDFALRVSLRMTQGGRHHIGHVHGLLLVAVVGGGLLGLVEVEAGAIGTVRHGQKLVGHRLGRLAVKHPAVGAHHRGHVEGLLVAALDLDGIHPRIG